MKSIGVTGGIGMGKSTTAEILKRRGIAVIDTDDIARQIVEPGQPALTEVVAAFGREVMSPDGRLNREALAGRVFGNDAARQQLEGILHPRIRAAWLKQLENWRREGRAVGVVIVPLLFETDAAQHVDQVICVACSAASQHTRLCARGWQPDQIAKRLQAQLPAEKKMALADFVVWTEGPVAVHAEQLARIL